MIRRNYLLPEESLHLKVTKNRDKTEQNNPIKHYDEVPPQRKYFNILLFCGARERRLRWYFQEKYVFNSSHALP